MRNRFCSVGHEDDQSFEPLNLQQSCSYKLRFEDIGRCLKCECIVTDVFGRLTEPVSAITAPILPGPILSSLFYLFICVWCISPWAFIWIQQQFWFLWTLTDCILSGPLALFNLECYNKFLAVRNLLAQWLLLVILMLLF